MVDPNFLTGALMYLAVLLVLLGSPLAGLAAVAFLAHAAKQTQKWIWVWSAALVFAIAFSVPVGLSLWSAVATLAVYAIAYVLYCFLSISSFRVWPRPVGLIVGIVFSSPVFAAIAFCQPIAFTAAFHDDIEYAGFIGQNLKCYVTTFGDATTRDGGFSVTIKRKLSMLEFVEKRLGSVRYSFPDFDAPTACERASIDVFGSSAMR